MEWYIALALIAAILAVWAIVRSRGRRPATEPLEPPSGMRRQPPRTGEIAVSVAGGTSHIHYLTAGAHDADRPALVFVHGLGGSIQHFSGTLMPELSRDHFVLAIDRPGYGMSTRPPKGASHLSEQAELLRTLLNRLQIERPIVIGHSFGGSVALNFALEHPDALSGLALLAPAAFPFKMKPPLPDQTVDNPLMRRAIAYTLGPLMAVRSAEMFKEAAFGPQQAPDDYESAGGGDLAQRASQIEATMEDGALLRGDLAAQAPRYRELRAPVSVLFGDADRILTFEEHGPPLKAAAPHAELRALEGVGHMLPFAAKEACLEAIRDVSGSAEALQRWRGAAHAQSA